jgi:hypothetical protein
MAKVAVELKDAVELFTAICAPMNNPIFHMILCVHLACLV